LKSILQELSALPGHAVSAHRMPLFGDDGICDAIKVGSSFRLPV
jgi:hypothetical protein